MASLRTTKTTPVALQRKIDQADANDIYIGFAKIGEATSSAVWQIQKITISGTVTSFQWANGVETFSNIWDNRASLSYS